MDSVTWMYVFSSVLVAMKSPPFVVQLADGYIITPAEQFEVDDILQNIPDRHSGIYAVQNC